MVGIALSTSPRLGVVLVLISSSAGAAVMSVNNSHRRGVVSLHPLDVHDLDCSSCGDCCGRVRLAVPEDLWQLVIPTVGGLCRSASVGCA